MNLGSSAVTGNLNLISAGGTGVASRTFSLPPLGLYQNSVASLFPAHAASFDSAGYWISVTPTSSAAKVIGTSLTPVSGLDNIVVNAVFINYNEFVFPQVVGGAVGGTTYTTLLTLTNYRSTAQTVALTLTQASGAAVTVDRTIPAFGVLRSPVTSLFGLATVDGWLLVESSDYIGGIVTYIDDVNGGSTAVQMQGAGDTSLIFGHIADLSPWWTGIALTNPSNLNAQVEVYAFDPSGNLIGGPAQSSKAAFTLGPGKKTAFLLGEVVPQTQSRSSDGGYVFVRSVNGVKLYGAELFFLRSGRVYANVPASRVGSLGFLPPGATTGGTTTAGGGTVAITKVYTGPEDYNAGQQSFRTGETVYLYMVTNNTTGADANATRQFRASATNGYSLVNVTYSGPTRAGNNWIYWAYQTIPSNAPGGVYTFTGTHTWNGVVSTLSTTFRVESDIVISGTVYRAPTPSFPFENPLAGASLVIVGNTRNYTATTDANGVYSITLPLSLRDQTTKVIMQVSAAGYLPQAVPIDLTGGSQTINVTLSPTGTNVVIETDLHHLGDSYFSTTLNAGLQLLTAEGLTFTKTFEVPADYLAPNFTEASLQITVNAAETSDPVLINGATVARLNNSQVGPQTYYIWFPISNLRAGSNTLVIQANGDGMGGYDDFEFSNVLIRFSNPAFLQ